MAAWIWPSYYVIAVYWIISGAEGIVQSLNLGPFATSVVIEGVKIDPGISIVGLVFSALSVVVGFGLLFKIEFMRGIVNVLCFLQILNGLLGLWTGVLSSALLGPIGLLITIMSIFNIVTGALMIYIIGETD